MKARDGHRFRSRDSESNGTNRRRVPGGGGDITREDEITAVVGRLLFLCGSNGFTPSVSLSVKMKRRKHTIFLLGFVTPCLLGNAGEDDFGEDP